jgi:cytochrome c oxidase subunit 2
MFMSEAINKKNNGWKYYSEEFNLNFPNSTNSTNSTKVPEIKQNGFILFPLTAAMSVVFADLNKDSKDFDAPTEWQINFQDPGSPMMEKIIDFHHDLQFFLIIIFVVVFWVLVRTTYLFSETTKTNVRYAFEHQTQLELIWTIIPTVVLILVATPSFALLYAIDELHNPGITMKVFGNQWYWSYEFSDYISKNPDESIKFDSYMLLEEDLQKGQYRLLEVDERVLVPEKKSLRVLVTSRDVIHSWAIPSLGIKLDACPGRLNQVGMFIKRRGVYFGQCSELCGVNHAFMPIVIEAVNETDYKNWIISKINI